VRTHLQSSAQDQRSSCTARGTGRSNCAGHAAEQSTLVRFSAGGSITQPSPSEQMSTHQRKAGSLP